MAIIINILHFRPGLKMDGIKQFFKNTLNGKQYFDKIDSSAQEYVESLIKYNLVTYNDGYHVTPFGIIVSTNIMEANKIYIYFNSSEKLINDCLSLILLTI